MKKFILFMMMTVMMLLEHAPLTAQPVNRSEALKRARKFMNEKGREITEKIYPAHARAAGDLAQPEFYVFNADHQQGFVIISGDDRLPSVLGYSEQGAYVDDEMPENMRSWLRSMSDNIAYMQQMNITHSRRAIENLGEPIQSQLTCRWDQRTPFNNDCPVVYVYTDSARTIPYKQPSGRGVTGCAATALAQVLYQWKYPSQTVMEIPAINSIKGENVVVLPDSSRQHVWTMHSDTAIPAGTVIDWDNMIDEYTQRDTNRKVIVDADGNIVVHGTPEQQAAVASLMHICSAGQSMAYGPEFTSGSAAVGFIAGVAAGAYLGFMNVTYQQQGPYDYDTWIQRLYDELKEARAVSFGGSSSSGGHAFVIDGYDKEDIFHVNWGWSGMADGYYRICELLPAEQGTGGAFFNDGFRNVQSYFTGIYPDAKLVDPDVHCASFDCLATEVDVKDGSYTLPMNVTTLNQSHYGGYEAQLALGVFDADGKLLAVSDTIQGRCDYFSGITRLDEPMTITLTETMPGIQTLHLCYRLKDDDEWKICLGNNQLRVTLDDAGAKARVEKVAPYKIENVVQEAVYTFEAGKDIDFACRAKVTAGVVHETMTVNAIQVEMKDGAVVPVSTTTPEPLFFLHLYSAEGTEFDVKGTIHDGVLQPGTYLLQLQGASTICENPLGILTINDPTGIQPVQLVIDQPSKYYDLQGRPVNSPHHGIYLHNGKKVIIK